MIVIKKLSIGEKVYFENEDVVIKCDVPDGVDIKIITGNLIIKGNVAKSVKIYLEDKTMEVNPNITGMYEKPYGGTFATGKNLTLSGGRSASGLPRGIFMDGQRAQAPTKLKGRVEIYGDINHNTLQKIITTSNYVLHFKKRTKKRKKKNGNEYSYTKKFVFAPGEINNLKLDHFDILFEKEKHYLANTYVLTVLLKHFKNNLPKNLLFKVLDVFDDNTHKKSHIYNFRTILDLIKKYATNISQLECEYSYESPLAIAFRKSPVFAEILLKKGFKLNNQCPYSRDSHLMRYVVENKPWALEMLLKYNFEDVNYVGGYGDTVLTTALEKGNIECADILMKNGAKINIENNIHFKGMEYYAKKGGCLKEYLKLKKKYVDKNISSISFTVAFDSYRSNEDENTLDNSSLSRNILRINNYSNK